MAGDRKKLDAACNVHKNKTVTTRFWAPGRSGTTRLWLDALVGSTGSSGVPPPRLSVMQGLDEEINAMKAFLATEASAERDEAMRRQRDTQNVESTQQLESTIARSDYDRAGQERRALASAARARREAADLELVGADKHNDAERHRLSATSNRMDMVTDEGTRWRAAARAEDKRAARAVALAHANAEAARLTAVGVRTDDGNGSGAPTDMLSLAYAALPPLERGSRTHVVTYSRFKASEVARQQVVAARALREGREREKAVHAVEWAASGRERIQSARARQERIEGIKLERWEDRRQTIRELKEEAAEREAARDVQRGLFAAEVSERVAEARALQARMEEEEARRAAAAQVESHRTREATMRAVGRLQRQQLEWRRVSNGAVKAARAAIGLARRSSREAARAAVEAQRQASRERANERVLADVAYIERARANRERAIDFREGARSSREAAVARKHASMVSERAITQCVTLRAASLIPLHHATSTSIVNAPRVYLESALRVAGRLDDSPHHRQIHDAAVCGVLPLPSLLLPASNARHDSRRSPPDPLFLLPYPSIAACTPPSMRLPAASRAWAGIAWLTPRRPSSAPTVSTSPPSTGCALSAARRRRSGRPVRSVASISRFAAAAAPTAAPTIGPASLALLASLRRVRGVARHLAAHALRDQGKPQGRWGGARRSAAPLWEASVPMTSRSASDANLEEARLETPPARCSSTDSHCHLSLPRTRTCHLSLRNASLLSYYMYHGT